MFYDEKIKQKALHLRSRGYSFHEIASLLILPQSTIYSWTHSLVLDENAQARIQARRTYGVKQTKIYFKNKRISLDKEIKSEIIPIINLVPLTKELAKIYCSLLFWAEGTKSLSCLKFTNSDPNMIAFFLKTFRLGFDIDEKKFRVILHLHEYHDQKQMMQQWSSITKIPLPQFWKTYLKPHTKKRIHENYPGTCAITYYDSRLAHKLTLIYQELTK